MTCISSSQVSHKLYTHNGSVPQPSEQQNITMQINPRPARADDLNAIEDIIRNAYSIYIPRIGRAPGPMSDDYSALIEAGRVQVVERDGVIQGLLVLVPGEEAMLLDNVAVAPSAQGMGLGRGLLEYAERSAKEAGFGSIKLYTNEAMTENISLYSRFGYVETHRAEEKGLKRVYMAKSLT